MRSRPCSPPGCRQLGARLAVRVGGRAIRPLLVVMSLALTAKLLSDPANPLTAFLLG